MRCSQSLNGGRLPGSHLHMSLAQHLDFSNMRVISLISLITLELWHRVFIDN